VGDGFLSFQLISALSEGFMVVALKLNATWKKEESILS
jgi:hypothetical protein